MSPQGNTCQIVWQLPCSPPVAGRWLDPPEIGRKLGAEEEWGLAARQTFIIHTGLGRKLVMKKFDQNNGWFLAWQIEDNNYRLKVWNVQEANALLGHSVNLIYMVISIEFLPPIIKCLHNFLPRYLRTNYKKNHSHKKSFRLLVFKQYLDCCSFLRGVYTFN